MLECTISGVGIVSPNEKSRRGEEEKESISDEIID
jgi:hypothetical protein